MTNETKNQFEAILAKAQEQAKTKTVLRSAQSEQPKVEQAPVNRPELSEITIEDVLKQEFKDIDERPNVVPVVPVEIAPVAIEQTKTEQAPVNTSLQIIDYSEKAFALIGDTKPVKEKIKSLGGRWNMYLTCGPGWIFSKRQLTVVKNAFGL